MTLYIPLALIPPTVIGLALVSLLWPRQAQVNGLLLALLGVGCGLGVDALLYFLWSLAFNPANLAYLWVEGALALGLAGLALWRRRALWRKLTLFSGAPQAWISWGLAAVFVGVAGLTALAFVRFSLSQRYGTFDAYAIWNLRARFIYLDSAHWLKAFSPLLNWKAHADYPLLIPMNVLRLWEVLGSPSVRAPIVLAGLFTFGLIGIVFAGVSAFRDAGQGALGGLLLLGTPALFVVGATQTADIPLTFFIFAACLLAYAYTRDRRPGWLALAGLAAGLAAWAKNEGLMFLLALSVTLLLFNLRRLRRTLPYFAGLALPLLINLYFKISIAPPGDILQGQTPAILLGKVLDGSRYVLIAQTFAQYLLALGGWKLPILAVLLLYAVLLRRQLSAAEKSGLWMLLCAAGLTLLGYAGVYLITPHPLAWHMQYSLDRLVFHVFPTLLFCALVWAASPQEIWETLRSKATSLAKV